MTTIRKTAIALFAFAIGACADDAVTGEIVTLGGESLSYRQGETTAGPNEIRTPIEAEGEHFRIRATRLDDAVLVEASTRSGSRGFIIEARAGVGMVVYAYDAARGEDVTESFTGEATPWLESAVAGGMDDLRAAADKLPPFVRARFDVMLPLAHAVVVGWDHELAPIAKGILDTYAKMLALQAEHDPWTPIDEAEYTEGCAGGSCEYNASFLLKIFGFDQSCEAHCVAGSLPSCSSTSCGCTQCAPM